MFRRKARSEPRFDPRKQALVEVAIRGADGAWANVASGKLSDLSHGGAKLTIDQPLELQAAVLLRFRNTAKNLDLEATGKVCWMTPTADDGFAIGCTFVPDLPEDILEQLFASGLLERRIFRRRALKIPAMAQWELEATAAEAFLWDLSEGGFCVLSPQARQTGRRLLLTVDTACGKVEIPAKTQWTLKVGEGYVVGCEFLNKQGYITLAELEAQAKEGKSGAKAGLTPPEQSGQSLGRKFKAVIDRFLSTPAGESH